MTEITRKSLPGGAVLLEKELPAPELPADLRIENIQPIADEPQQEIICQFCAQHGERTPATALLVPSSNGFAMIPAVDAPPPGVEFMSLCTPHAQRAKKQIKKRLRAIKRYSTNLYTQEQ